MRRLAALARSPTARVFALASALTLISAWSLVRHLSSALPSDLGDPILETWILWWNAHAMPLTTRWWNAPMFVPLPGAFALAEALLAFVPLTTPLQWAGLSPVATHNIVFLLSGPMAAVGAFVLAHKLTGRNDAALIAALAFGFSPYRIAQLSHMQVLWACWMPLGLAALHDYITTHRQRALIWFALCWMMNGFTNGYFLVYFPVLVGCWMLWFCRRWQDLTAIGIAAIVASVPFLPMLAGYASRQRALGVSRQISEIRLFSADVTALFASSPRAWLSAHWTLPPGPEGELYPGLAIVALGIAGVVIAASRSGSTASTERRALWRWGVGALAIVAAALALLVMWSGGSELHLGPWLLSVHRPSRLLTVAFWLAVIVIATHAAVRRAWTSRSLLGFYALAAAVMYFFALGPEPHAGATQVLYKPPYTWLMYLPGFDAVRVPARFGLLMILCLAQVGALAYARLIAVNSRTWLGVMSLAILAEGWIVMPVAPLPRPLPLPDRAPAGALVLELPIETGFESNTLALLHALEHGRPIVNGFSGYIPPHYYALGLALKGGDATALEAIREIGPLVVFVDAARDTGGVHTALVAGAGGANPLETNDRGAWFFLPQSVAPALAALPTQLTPRAVAATTNSGDTPLLNDGRSNTRWSGDIHGESHTDTITLTFDAPVTINAIEIDQGLWSGYFPRDLEVVLTTDNGDITVFRGPTGGLAVRGALASRDVTMRIPLTPSSPARSMRLISHPKGEQFTWSVGEIRAFGVRP